MAPRASAFAYVYDRSIGLGAPQRFRDAIHAETSRKIAAVSNNFIYHAGMKTWAMELDPVDDRYLLVGTAKSNVLLFDLHPLDRDATRSSSDALYNTSHPLAPVCSAHAISLKRVARSGGSAPSPPLQFGVSAVDWYPVDGGMFITSSLDGCVRVWDGDMFRVVSEFALPSKVFGAKFSRVARSHSLIAAATAQGEVRLCDLATDASVHSLLGHTDEIWSLAWSLENEHHLSTGSRNGEIRMWDIRRSGSTACLLCLNHEGAAATPGRASVHTNIARLPAMSLATASRPVSSLSSRKRQRLDSAHAHSSTSAAAARVARSRVEAREAQLQYQQQREQQSHTRASTKRNDPHAAASTSFVTAHHGGVNSLAYTPNGRFLLSSGTDQRLRLWNSKTGEHAFANYEGVANHVASRSLQMAVVQEADAAGSTLVFHPNGRDGQLHAYDVFGARGVPMLRSTAHYEQITACVYRRSMRELFTGGEDGIIMKWRPAPLELDAERPDDSSGDAAHGSRQQPSAIAGAAAGDVDAWSDDDDDGDSDDSNAQQGDVFIPPILREL